ncbi:hypothetical protein [Aeromonas sobria]|uniref:hypothetical protein n=1 Tax=Aeromonas sobria TaxID=646 RepID=UPI0011181D31|nr:hypothetical protein [Aeromonas sobria]TNI86627.1 hypothetical protein CF119_07565 [Aeromonas sobria]
MNSTNVVTLFGDDKILSFDLELTRDEKLRHLGALLAERELNLKGPQDLSLKELNALAQGADRQTMPIRSKFEVNDGNCRLSSWSYNRLGEECSITLHPGKSPQWHHVAHIEQT